MWIDCHVHLRDDDWKHKETIMHGLEVARDSGLDAVFDMPNTSPPVISRARVLERLSLAQAEHSDVFFGAYVGVTADKNQLREAVECYREFFPKIPEAKTGVIGLKMFAGKSVGDLTVSGEDEQRFVYSKLAELKYGGVLAVHCEKESGLHPELWDSKNPASWNLARPEKAETDSIIDQINFSALARYSGHLHICHVSCSNSVYMIDRVRRGRRISCGVTPHHLLLDSSYMQGENGILYKVNPPLRSPETRKSLLQDFLAGDIDILESDHAPHTLPEKLEQQMSGIPNLASWSDFLEILIGKGASPELIDMVAFTNVNRIFGTQIPKREFHGAGNHAGEYAFNPYAGVQI